MLPRILPKQNPPDYKLIAFTIHSGAFNATNNLYATKSGHYKTMIVLDDGSGILYDDYKVKLIKRHEMAAYSEHAKLAIYAPIDDSL